MLAGRTAECEHIAALLDAARHGHGGRLMIGGDAGIGKTALCRYAIDAADGFTVLRTAGVEMEAGLPYAALHALVRPLLQHLEGLPTVQRGALESALSLSDSTAQGRLSVAAAVLGLFAAATESGPLLVVVDDFQWVDASSTEALTFAARRLVDETVAFIIAMRGDPLPTARAAQLPAMPLDGIDVDAVQAVLAAAGATVEREVAEALHEQTAGNPLALREIAGQLSPAQRAGREPLPDPVPAGDHLIDLYRTRLEGFNATARRALLFVAAAGQLTVEELGAAGAAPADLDGAEDAGLIERVADTVRFCHPLVRSAAYHAASPVERRRAHRSLAAAALDPDRAAWHLAEGTAGTDEQAAATVELAALRSLRRSGFAEAALAMERAGHLTPHGHERIQRLLRAAQLHELTGRPDRVRALVDETLPPAVDPDVRGDLLLLRGYVGIWDGDLRRACEDLIEHAGVLEDASPAKAVAMLTFAAMTLMMDGALDDSLMIAERAHQTARRVGDEAIATAAAGLAHVLVLTGHAREAKPLVDRCLEYLRTAATTDLQSHLVLVSAVHCLVGFEEYDHVRAILEPVARRARAQGAVSLLPMPVKWLAEVDFRQGRWTRALAEATEALELSIEVHANELPHTLVVVARMEAAQGRASECLDHVGQALDIAARTPVGSIPTFAHAALGLLALGTGDVQRAVEELNRADGYAAAHGMSEPMVIPFAADHVEALARAGNDEAARAVLHRFEANAGRSLATWPHAAAARCRGLLAGDDFEEHFAEALDRHRGHDMPFAQARTLLCLGERRRRAGQQRQARDPLHDALAIFERLGAEPWAHQARAELRASGERLAPPRAPMMERLTPQELNVAMAVAQGGTNKDVAAALFLSPKTVENHLSRIYAKLGVRSRTQLARAVTAVD